MLVLGIESSCDDTGVALYDGARGLLGHLLHSQTALHADFGGVVPELASRDHFGHRVGSVSNHEAFFDLEMRRIATFVGLV